MIIHFSPQRADKEIFYEFQKETVTATMNDITDTFDFSELQEGDIAALNEETGKPEIETTLPFLPILDARRENGKVIVTVLKYHGEDAPYEERFPEPLEAD